MTNINLTFDSNSYISELNEIQQQDIGRSILNSDSLCNSSIKVNVRLPNQFEVRSQMLNSSPLQASVDDNENLQNSFEDNEEDSYLNISFQEIVNLLINNESPTLSIAIKTAIYNSNIIVLVLLVYNLTLIVIDTFALFLILRERTSEAVQQEIAYYSLRWLSCALILYSLLNMRYTITECQQSSEVSSQIIEFLKYTIRNNTPFNGEDFYDDEQELTQAQWVAKSISNRIKTHNWINFLMNYQSSHLFSINRLILVTESLLFFWGNTIIIQYASVINTAIIIYTLLFCYFVVITLIICTVITTFIIPIMLTFIIWQAGICLYEWFFSIYISFRQRENIRMREVFLNRLQPKVFHQVKRSQQEMCVICLGTYAMDDMIIQLPCNVQSSTSEIQINHIFHSECVRVWIEEHGNCPVCRKQFIDRQDD